ncbi:MOSC domain-containing protein [Blastococcus goldschmidtiae]|uniref:MOSC domain-containing protein n=1 Tax=Blastococcus goldschmidtiae TaxID=3075546 RepID=A0ABU2K724_9ACTN|nr:MOSC domain-containing protein [Blastococcus sp. DSM 46792]MDT0275984.1 MOSC domain-containing protein [Blastococcus sp. DSM 46792]
MTARVEAVCVSGSDLLPLPDKRPNRSGIDKRPVPGRIAVGELGLDGDVQVNKKHHGGEGQAVYAYAQADADWWAAELDRDLPPGRFGENLRTSGLDLRTAVIGERWTVGTTLLEVTAWRTPCANFARFWGIPDLVKRFAAHGATGAYLRVLQTGELGAGDAVEVVHRPDHGITVETAFRIVMTEKSRLAELAPVVEYVPERARAGLAAKIAARSAAVS